MSSLEDRVSKPESGMDGSHSSSWADEATNAADANSAPPPVVAQAEQDMNDMEKAQTDGAAGGDAGIIEPSYDVNVKLSDQLSDLQADPNDPLFSTTSFDALGL